MSQEFHFTFSNLKAQYEKALSKGYSVITCEQYVELKKGRLPVKTIVNRIDIDFSVKRAYKLGVLFNELGINGTFFIRLHAPEYNPFSFENYKIIKFLIETGHEIGYHSEIVDQAAIWSEDEAQCLKRDIEIINKMFNISIVGVASHGGTTGLNNLDFWQDREPQEFGLLYEGYDKLESFNLFQESFYISDSEWTQWKCYDKGTLLEGDRRSFGEHIKDGHELIHLLIHPDTYFESHFYENEK